MENVIEVNLGIGLNMFFPEPTKVIIQIDEEHADPTAVEIFKTNNDEENN